MLEQADVCRGQRVLEAGSGTGYNAALLAELVGPQGHVTTVEYDAEVARRTAQALASVDYSHVDVRCGYGRDGVPERAPFDRIVITAGAFDVSEAWLDQLAPGGPLVIPLRLPWPVSAALERRGHWVSLSSETCGLIPG
jgi:protein-L-isoaspartate(D-aspartate) O-methyltransferase